MFIIVAGGNAPSLLSLSLFFFFLSSLGCVGAHKRVHFTICPPSPPNGFSLCFLLHTGSCGRSSVRGEHRGRQEGEAGKGARWNTYRDNYVTFCFATTRDFFLASVPASWRTRLVLLPPIASGRVVSHPTKGRQRDEGVNANEFTILQSRRKNLRTMTICNLHTNARGTPKYPLEVNSI